MSKREILLADNDSTERTQLADSISSAGYDVETTDSTAHVFCSVLEKQIPVVLLGSGCDKKIALANLVPLLKKCNRRVTIILVSDEEPLPALRTVRQEGIFYHALKPAGRDDTEEILTAVECAFNKIDREEKMQVIPSAAKQEASPAAAMPWVADLITKQPSLDLTEPIKADTTRESWHGEKNIRVKAAALLTALSAAAAGCIYGVLAATKDMKESGDLVIWCFLGFFALIVLGQLLPAFFSVRSARKVVAERLKEGLAANGKKEQAPAQFDKY